ncbi:hypothetical protein CGCVW01_v006122 [Colletotrichum viniferum]|nr:hypothetical protein CGCVW01_v006122 [Colletotrichum viniferum]
MSKEETTVG